MKINIAFTGPTNPDVLRAEHLIEEVLSSLPAPPKAFYSGGADGIDTLCALAARDLYPDVEHHLIVPKGEYFNRALLKFSWAEIHEVEGGYMKRNDALISYADMLIAFPLTINEVQRSGTWATIRRARKKDIAVHIYPLA